MARVYNFSAGPSMLPEKVLRQAQAELLEYGDSGQSVRSQMSFVFQISLTDIFLMSQPYQLPPTESLSLYVRNVRKLLFHGRSVFLSQAS